MTRDSKTWRRRALKGAAMTVVGTAKVADRAASALFRYVTTDHLGITKDLPIGLGPWQEFKFIWVRAVYRIVVLLLIWGVIMGAILYFGRQ